MPLLAGGGCHVSPPSLLFHTPPEKTPASIVLPPVSDTSDWTDSLSLPPPDPCACGAQLPPVDFHSPESVPAKTVVPVLDVSSARTFVVSGFEKPPLNDDHVAPPLLLLKTPPPSRPA
jgi:hypothetical protein